MIFSCICVSILLLCAYALYRGPARRLIPLPSFLQRKKQAGRGGKPGDWLARDSVIGSRGGGRVYLTDLKRKSEAVKIEAERKEVTEVLKEGQRPTTMKSAKKLRKKGLFSSSRSGASSSSISSVYRNLPLDRDRKRETTSIFGTIPVLRYGSPASTSTSTVDITLQPDPTPPLPTFRNPNPDPHPRSQTILSTSSFGAPHPLPVPSNVHRAQVYGSIACTGSTEAGYRCGTGTNGGSQTGSGPTYPPATYPPAIVHRPTRSCSNSHLRTISSTSRYHTPARSISYNPSLTSVHSLPHHSPNTRPNLATSTSSSAHSFHTPHLTTIPQPPVSSIYSPSPTNPHIQPSFHSLHIPTPDPVAMPPPQISMPQPTVRSPAEYSGDYFGPGPWSHNGDNVGQAV